MKTPGALRGIHSPAGIVCLTSGLVVLLATQSIALRAQQAPQNAPQVALRMSLELASELTNADAAARSEILHLLDEQIRLTNHQTGLVFAAFEAKADAHYRSLYPSQTTQALDYLRAFEVSYARFKGAEVSEDREWSARQLKAAQQYAALAANALDAEAQGNDGEAIRLRTLPFAMRRPPEQQVAFVERLRSNGLSPQHREWLRTIGFTDAEIDEALKKLLQRPPDQIGFSAVEWLSDIAAVRRNLAKQLAAFAQESPGAVAGTSMQTFGVGNPHDREETIDLYIRPVSIPPDWKLSITDAEEQPKFKVREVEPGKHYAVTLPAKEQVKVASVVVPVGEVGTNTTARWAVEGKIRDELIGGIVLEMNTPHSIADLTLPPVGSKEAEDELPASASWAWARIAAGAAAGIVVLGSLVHFFFSWRRRHRTGPPPAA